MWKSRDHSHLQRDFSWIFSKFFEIGNLYTSLSMLSRKQQRAKDKKAPGIPEVVFDADARK